MTAAQQPRGKRRCPDGVTVITALGERAVQAPWLIRPVRQAGGRARLEPLLMVARIVAVAMPASSAAGIRSACRRWSSALEFWGIPRTEVDEQCVLAYVVARCCPPVGAVLPPQFGRPVLPQSVAAEVGLLRRAAALDVEEMGPCAAALTHPSVSHLLRQLGAGVRRLKTAKRPLLLREVRAFWEARRAEGGGGANGSGSSGHAAHARWCGVRDGFALVFGFFFACRVSEVIGMKSEDIREVVLEGGRRALRLTFRSVKNRRTLLDSHEPFTVTCANPLLLDAFALFRAVVGLAPSSNLFRRESGPSQSLSREWFAAVVSAAAPGATPHSCRVGMATELWAAGAGVDDIMAVGRWTSAAALLYVLSPVQQQVEATDRLGEGGLVYTPEGIQKAWPVQGSREDMPTAEARTWAQLLPQETEGDEYRGLGLDDWA